MTIGETLKKLVGEEILKETDPVRSKTDKKLSLDTTKMLPVSDQPEALTIKGNSGRFPAKTLDHPSEVLGAAQARLGVQSAR